MKGLTKILAILIGGLVVVFLLVVFFISPMLTEVTTSNANVRAKKVELLVLDQQIRAFKNAQADLTRATRKDDILNALPNKENLVDSVLDLEKAANTTKTTLTLQIKELGAKDKPSAVIGKKVGIEEVPYEITTVSDFPGMVNFISYMEHLPHFTELSGFALSSELIAGVGTDATRSGKVFGDINAVFFTQTAKPTPKP